MKRLAALVDVEVTNHCNARCVMCPRDRTPATGFMSEAIFRHVVERAVEYGRVRSFAIGGLGEPLLHRQIVDFVSIAAKAGLKPALITNGSLLTPALARQLVDAGLKNLNASLGGYRKPTYEGVQKGLKFETVYPNFLNFLRIARGRAALNIQISPTAASYGEAEEMARFWRAGGAQFCMMFPQSSNRGGALDVRGDALITKPKNSRRPMPRGVMNVESILAPSQSDHRRIIARAKFPCGGKDIVTFISWQGQYHVCNSDFEKRHPLGNVELVSFEDAYAAKARITPENCAICAQCSLIDRNPAPVSFSFLAQAALYLLGSRFARLRGPCPHPDIGNEIT